MTLIPSKRRGGKSPCNGPLRRELPPLQPPMSQADRRLTTWSADDAEDVAYKGKPLYTTFKKDTAPCDTNGERFPNGGLAQAIR